MGNFWTFIGGIAVGILSVASIFTMEENEKSSSTDCDDELELDEESKNEEQKDEDNDSKEGKLIFR